jgi:hypothetical protein
MRFGWCLVPGETVGVSAAAVDPSRADSALETWTTADGDPFAQEYHVGTFRCLLVPGVATFVSDHDCWDRVLVFPAPGVGEEELDRFVRGGIAAIFAQGAGLEVLHASAVLSPAGVVGFCGRPGSGKSTIAYGLAARGHLHWADDALALDAATPPPTAFPLPFAARLRPEPAAHYARLGANPQSAPDRPQPLRLLFVLGRHAHDSGGIDIVPLSPADRFLATLAHASYYDFPDEARRERMIEQFLRLAGTVSLFTVSFPSGLQHLESLLDRIEAHIESLD